MKALCVVLLILDVEHTRADCQFFTLRRSFLAPAICLSVVFERAPGTVSTRSSPPRGLRTGRGQCRSLLKGERSKVVLVGGRGGVMHLSVAFTDTGRGRNKSQTRADVNSDWFFLVCWLVSCKQVQESFPSVALRGWDCAGQQRVYLGGRWRTHGSNTSRS